MDILDGRFSRVRPAQRELIKQNCSLACRTGCVWMGWTFLHEDHHFLILASELPGNELQHGFNWPIYMTFITVNSNKNCITRGDTTLLASFKGSFYRFGSHLRHTHTHAGTNAHTHMHTHTRSVQHKHPNSFIFCIPRWRMAMALKLCSTQSRLAMVC